MRLASLFIVLLMPGCWPSCDWDDDYYYYNDAGGLDEDECDEDIECDRFDDGLFCNGHGVCDEDRSGVGTCRNVPTSCELGEEFCSEALDACMPCTSPGDSPACRWLVDAGMVDACDEGLGLSCLADESCREGLECLPPQTAIISPIVEELAISDVCTSACDPSADTCPSCSACVDVVRVGFEHVPAADFGRTPYCARRCEPSDLNRGGCFPGSCDPATGTCQRECTSDLECRLVRNAAGELVEDPTRAHVCDPVSRRCRLWGVAGARVGDPCTLDTECTIDGECLRDAGWPSTGYCARMDCQWPAYACGAGEQCHHRALERPACLIACTVGADPEDARLGVGGHGEGCAPGLACRWDGVTGPEGNNGGCVPGNYNDVATSNVGASCTSDVECYSPYGLGRCAFLRDGAGTCALLDCEPAGGIVPATAASFCDGAAESCTTIGDETMCVRRCATADECAPGYACTPESVCLPTCAADTECRAGEVCSDGACAPI